MCLPPSIMHSVNLSSRCDPKVVSLLILNLHTNEFGIRPPQPKSTFQSITSHSVTNLGSTSEISVVILPQILDRHSDVPTVTLLSILDSHPTNPFSSHSLFSALRNTLRATYLPISSFRDMDIPVQKYFLSPLNRNVDYHGMYSCTH